MNISDLRSRIAENKHTDEPGFVAQLIANPALSEQQRRECARLSKDIVQHCRKDTRSQTLLDSFLQEFGLSNKEGVALMCLAEALLRVPDKMTADRLIAEKINSGDWRSHSGNSDSIFVNGATWGMVLTGKMIKLDSEITENPGNWISNLSSKLSEPVVRRAILQAMRIMGGQYVLGRSIDEGLKKGAKQNERSTRFSFDMLGEAARTMRDADRYYEAYNMAFDHIGRLNQEPDIYAANGISVKLSALHPQYHFAHYQTVMDELLPRITALCMKAKKFNIALSIDAEEAARLELSLDIFESLARNPDLAGWDGLGFVLQAYQKRAPAVAQWLTTLARETNRKLMVRLVKGAYWDAEIKHAQDMGLDDYPVFTRKQNTDVCYLHCAKLLLSADDCIYSQFATHNAYTTVAIIELARGLDNMRFEFQRLHGMGELLYKHLDNQFAELDLPLRIYAPIGQHEDLLPYLVRRLLENGANSSFVNRFLDDDTPIDELITDLYEDAARPASLRHSKIPLPLDVFIAAGEPRRNAKGIDLDDQGETDTIKRIIEQTMSLDLQAHSIVGGKTIESEAVPVDNPAHLNRHAGKTSYASHATIENALALADAAKQDWLASLPQTRANILFKAADLMEDHMLELIGLIVREAGRTIPDCVSEVREAVDFCRYYALQTLDTQTGEDALSGRGTFFCVSPWNFPLAIFTGQIAAALAAGNCVLAKPAEQTPLVAARAVELLHQAGCPVNVLHLIIGTGAAVGGQVTPDPRIDGIAFTGSTDTAKLIDKQIAQRTGETIPLIAETGGQNCMIVDSTALPEQVTDDVISSAFHSAGQRCSALRVLYVQDVIADKVLGMLEGAMQAVSVGDPSVLASDVGPVIDSKARNSLSEHLAYIEGHSLNSFSVPLSDELVQEGHFFQPRVFEIDSIKKLTREVFGPILHVIRYKAEHLDRVIADINSTGFGLTLGVHSRIEAVADYIFRKTRAGNTYINRNMIGAVVGVNPFGGKGLSGTGPKAGGPNYLYRFQRTHPLTDVEQNALPASDLSSPDKQVVEQMMQHATAVDNQWGKTAADERAQRLQRAIHESDASDKHRLSLIADLVGNRINLDTELPGPTGEQNNLYIKPNGPIALVLDHATEAASARAIAVIALTAGNSVILQPTCEHSVQAANQLRAALAGAVPAASLQVLPVGNPDTVASDERIRVVAIAPASPFKHDVRLTLSQRQGAITPIVEIGGDFEHTQRVIAYLSYFINERTKTDNLVARGGNTQLFNLEE